ncbi:MAG: hypothetical protein WC045_04305 [Patescibacteria group bacterium]
MATQKNTRPKPNHQDEVTDLIEMREVVHRWIKQFPEGYWSNLDILERIDEEGAEIGRELSHLYGAKKKKATEAQGSVTEEIGDLLFTLCCLANKLGLQLGYTNPEGLLSRKFNRPTGFITETTVIHQLAEDYQSEYYPNQQHAPLLAHARIVRAKGWIADSIIGIEEKPRLTAKNKGRRLENRLAEVLFELAKLANGEKITFTEAFKATMNKCYGRDNYRFKRHDDPQESTSKPTNKKPRKGHITTKLTDNKGPFFVK